MEKYKYSVKFRLEQRRENPKDKNSAIITENVPILADITFGSKRLWYFTGYRIDASKWINTEVDGVKVQQVKRNCFNQKGESASEINGKLRNIRQAVENVFHRLEVNGIPATTINVREELRKELDEESTTRLTLIDAYNKFIEEESEASTWAKATIQKHRTILNHIQSYKKNLCFEDVNEDVLNGFVRYLIVNKGHSNSNVVKLIKDFKWFLNWATKKGLNKTLDYKNFVPKLKGASTSDKTNIIALSPDEFMQLFTMEIKTPYLDRVRDVFCFCCATSLRYSDVRNLKWSNVKDDRIEIVTIKTDDPIVIYFNEISAAIIKKHEINKGVSEYVLPVISNQKYNDYLKELGKLAGFDEPITRVHYRGSERIEVTLPKYEFMTSHVARKTFVTLSLYKGIPAEIIRSYTGHKDARVMERYFKFNNQEKKTQMQNFNFDEEAFKTVFDYEITDIERAIFDIEDKESYLIQITTNRDLAYFHLAMLFQRRGNLELSAEYLQKLSREKTTEFLQCLINSNRQ